MVKLVRTNEIVLTDDRVRKKIDENKITELGTSILRGELLNPPVVQNDGKTLIAGERRLRAIRELHAIGMEFKYNGETVPHNMVPVTLAGELSSEQLLEMEIDENIMREDITWQEKARALARLQRLRESQAESEGRKQSKMKTAEEIAGATGQKPGTVYEELDRSLILDAYMDDEEVQKAKDPKEALRVIEKKVSRQHREALADKYSTNEFKSQHKVILGDCRVEMGKLKEKFDCIIADPPYGLKAGKFGTMGGIEHEYDDDPDYAWDLNKTIIHSAFEVAKPEAHLYVFCEIRFFDEIAEWMNDAGWWVLPRPLIWKKAASEGVLPWPETCPRLTYEAIAYGIKGKKRLQVTGVPDVLAFSRGAILRGASKPVALYAELISRSCVPGDRVLDPCCGSGVVFSAAQQEKVIATGIEQDKAAVGMCYERIKNLDDEEEVDDAED